MAAVSTSSNTAAPLINSVLSSLQSGKLPLAPRDPYATLASELRVDPAQIVVVHTFLADQFSTLFGHYRVAESAQKVALKPLIELARLGMSGEDITNGEVRSLLREFAKSAGMRHARATDLLGDLWRELSTGPAALAERFFEAGKKLLASAPIRTNGAPVKFSDEEKVQIRFQLLRVMDDKNALASYVKEFTAAHPTTERQLDAMRAWLTIHPRRFIQTHCHRFLKPDSLVEFRGIARKVIDEGLMGRNLTNELNAFAKTRNLPPAGLRSALEDLLETVGRTIPK